VIIRQRVAVLLSCGEAEAGWLAPQFYTMLPGVVSPQASPRHHVKPQLHQAQNQFRAVNAQHPWAGSCTRTHGRSWLLCAGCLC